MGLIDRIQAWRLRHERLRRYREFAAKRAQRYAAAKPSRLSNWNGQVYERDFNSLIEEANPRLRARVRSLVRNFPPFKRAVNAHVAFVVGSGARFQSQVLDADGEADKKLRDKIESRFRGWMEKASVDGRLHFYECMQLAVRARLADGEFFFCWRTPKNRSRHPLALQFFEGDRVRGGLDLQPARPDSLIWQGIEFDPETGERFAYHVSREKYMPRFEYGYDRLPDDQVVHGFSTLRPGQLRGVSEFAPAIILADDMADYTTAEIDSAKMAARWLAFVTSPNPGEFQAIRRPDGSTLTEDQKIEELENGVIEYLKPGEAIQIAGASGRPGDSFDRFTSFVLRMASVSLDIPYEILSGDYQGINYSTSRASRNDFNMFLAPHKFWVEQHFAREVFRQWLRYEALTQDYLPDYYWTDPAHFEKAVWVPAGMLSIDPLREGKADIDAIRAGLKSPQEVILSNGGDPDQTMENIAKWRDEAAEWGMEFNLSGLSTAMQNNPAKLGAIESLGEDEKVYENPDGGE